MKLSDATLLLEDGTVIRGTSFGAKGTASGELCFTTGMTGYQEVFTDPSFTGQVLIMNNAHTGNYGVCPQDVESNKICVRAVIGRNLEKFYSRASADRSLEDYFNSENIVAIGNVDTRSLVIHVRKKGAMNCIISTDDHDVDSLRRKLFQHPSMSGLELSSGVSTQMEYVAGDADSPLRIAVLDLGIKKAIINCLTERNAFVKVFNAKTSFSEMEKFNPTGYFISNGPGDPSAMGYAVNTVKEILASQKPLFGICLGHQLLALANGISTFKMHHGHRGLNHPVKNLETGKCELTTQNHGFGINAEDVELNENIEITHVNLNDKSIEGIRLKNGNAFSVQYHPEATPGPHDSRYLFDDFINLIKSKKHA